MQHELATERVPVDKVTPYPGNPREGDVGAIAVSLEQNGQFRPIVVNRRDMTILAGNHTWKAAKYLGWSDIAVTFINVDEDQARRIVLADNRINDLAGYNDDVLSAMLQQVISSGGMDDLLGTGYDGDDLDDLLASLQEQNFNAPKPENAADKNVIDSPSYDEYMQRYANRSVRTLVCDYAVPVYQWLIATLDTLREKDEANADVLARLVSEASGTEIPESNEG